MSERKLLESSKLEQLTITKRGMLGRLVAGPSKSLVINNQELADIPIMKTSLEKLNIAHNQLVSLDLKNNSQLISLQITNNKLKLLDITRNEKLIPEPANFYQQEGIKLKLRVQENQIKDWGDNYDKDKLELEILTKEQVEAERERERQRSRGLHRGPHGPSPWILKPQEKK